MIADARPSTAVAPFRTSLVGTVWTATAEPAAFAALQTGLRQEAVGWRTAFGVAFAVSAYPIGAPEPFAVVVRTYARQIEASPSRMEQAFFDSARDLLAALRGGPLSDVRSGEPFSTTRHAGDGVLRVSPNGVVVYASPNAVSIMRWAGVDSRVTGMRAAELPGAGIGVSPVIGLAGAIAVQAETAGRVLSYRSMGSAAGTLVLVEDLTEARRRERELELKEATIREVHHRVKNNLQTIASLLRLQARRSDSEEVRHALAEATERASSMAAVHDLLSHSQKESVDFAEVARTVVELVRRGLLGDSEGGEVTVAGDTGEIAAGPAISLALVLVELIHNAFEHAFTPGTRGTVTVDLRRSAEELEMTVRDDGRGFPPAFDPLDAHTLGFTIVRSLVVEDLRGTLTPSSDAGGGRVNVRVPLPSNHSLESAS